MKSIFRKNINIYFKKTAQILVATVFIFQMALPIGVVRAQTSLDIFLPAPGQMVTQSPGYQPVLIKGVTINPEDPFQFDFIVDKGDSNLTGYDLKDTSEKLIKYFMTSLTIPEEELWVNLSPYEDDRIITQDFGFTEMGRDLLAQDYVLKQLTSSLLYPEKELGEKFWENVYEKIFDGYCSEDSPHALGEECDIRNLTVDTFNKVWVIPDKAVVYEHEQTAFIAESHLKVLLESDYEAMSQYQKKQKIELHKKAEKNPELADIASEIVKNIIIPEIEKEVNEGEHFAQLRQITNSLILASWYKKRLKESVLSQIYVDRGKVNGIDVEDKDVKNKIYHQYIEAFTKGVFNLIKEDYNPVTQQVIPRKYFSGGKDYTQISRTLDIQDDFANVTRKGQDEINQTIKQAQDGTDVFTVKANFEIDNALMSPESYKKLIDVSPQLAQTDFNNQPMSNFVNWMDEIINSVDSEITLEQFNALAQQLEIPETTAQQLLARSGQLAMQASEFSRSLPQDGKMNVFLLRDAFSLYAASKTLNQKAYALFLSKATFKLFSEERMMSDFIIPAMILETKSRMGFENRDIIPTETFSEFKEEFFNLFNELISSEETVEISEANRTLLRFRPNIQKALTASINYLNLIGITPQKIAEEGIRFIDTTKTGSFVLFLEGAARYMLTKNTEIAPEQLQNKTDGKMYYSDLSPALRFRENSELNEARQIENTYYPVTFAQQISDQGEPLVISADTTGRDQKNFLLQLVLLQSELHRIQKDNIRKNAEANQNISDDLAITTFDEAKQNLVVDIYKSVNSTPINLEERRIETTEDLQNYLESSSYAWQTAHESKKKNLLGILGALQKNLRGFLERQYPGINIKSISISGSMAEFWASYPEDALLPYGEDIDVYVVADQMQAGSLKISLEQLSQGQEITEELGDFGAYGVKSIDVWMGQEGSSNVDFYMLFGSGVTVWGNPIKNITSNQKIDQLDALMVLGRIERLIGINAWEMTGRLVVANWLLKGVAQSLELPYTEYDKDINANKAEAREVIQKNYEQIMISLANKKINAQKIGPNEQTATADDYAVNMNTNADDPNVGGIDLNTEYMDLQINRTGAALTIPVDLQRVQTMQIDGLVPVIFNISPTTNLQPLLGINQ